MKNARPPARWKMSNEQWATLTLRYPGLDPFRRGIEAATRGYVKNETHARTALANSQKRNLYSDGAKKIGKAIQAIKTVANIPGATNEIFSESYRLAIEADAVLEYPTQEMISFSDCYEELNNIKELFEKAAQNVERSKPGPTSSLLRHYVAFVAQGFRSAGLDGRISGGDNSHSLKCFLTDILTIYGFAYKERAIADAIRSLDEK